MKNNTVIIADDNASFLQQMIGALQDNFEVVGVAENGRQALDLIRRDKPDIVVLDLNMPILGGIEVTRELRKTILSPAVVICSVETDPQIVEMAREVGALGYVFKTHMHRDLVAAARSVARGESFVSPE